MNETDVPNSEQSTSNIHAPKFIDTINPLLKFSNDDLESMKEDVNDLIESDSSDDSDVDLGKCHLILVRRENSECLKIIGNVSSHDF